MNKHILRSRLGIKLSLVAATALVLSVGIFILLYSGVTWWVLNGDTFSGMWARESQKAVESFQRYVSRRHLSQSDTLGDLSWKSTHLAVRLYLSDQQDDPNWETILGERAADVQPILCRDGVIYAYAELSRSFVDRTGMVVSILLAILCYFAFIIPYLLHLLRRIARLNEDMQILSGGDLDYPIIGEGRDELGELSRSIEAMRRSVLSQMAAENAAVLANSRLITSLSHDLRTPLTKLTGYLEILRYKKYADEAEGERYLTAALEKAGQMKALSDEMFVHFRVSASEPDLPEEILGNLLLSQLLTEMCFDLTDAGFLVQAPPPLEDFRCSVNPGDIRRVFDNLYSNLKKYADPAVPLQMDTAVSDSSVTVTLCNAPRKNAPAESKGVGIPTVRDLLERNGGTLEIVESAGLYTARVTLPIISEDSLTNR